MYELPSMQLTESLLDGLPLGEVSCGADGRPQDEQNFDVLEFVDSMGLAEEDLALPDVNLALECSPTPAPQQSNVLAPQPAAQRHKEAERVERTRARNRRSQARHREKTKVQSPRVVVFHMQCVPRERLLHCAKALACNSFATTDRALHGRFEF